MEINKDTKRKRNTKIGIKKIRRNILGRGKTE
jgi:hypothetical protein